ncbi:MAG: LpqN/LpqT family lipoprotein, partial [Mycobacterium sp.]
MNTNTRNWRVVLGGVAAGTAAVIGLAGANASAEPDLPAPPAPAPATVTQTVTVTAAPVAATPSPAPAAASVTAAAAPAPAASTTAPAPASAPAPATEPALQPATSGTITEFFKDKGVALEPQKSTGFTALNIVLPVPPGWSIVPDPNVPDAFGVIADRKGGDGLYTSNAQLQVYKLVGDFDPREAITHGYIDSQKLRSWQSTSASLAEFGGFPSSVITGTYRDNDMTLNTTRRYVIAKTGSDSYLLSLSVTTAANQAVVTATATDGILNGFRVTDPAAAPPAAPAPAAAPEAPAPAAPAPAAPEAPAP